MVFPHLPAQAQKDTSTLSKEMKALISVLEGQDNVSIDLLNNGKYYLNYGAYLVPFTNSVLLRTETENDYELVEFYFQNNEFVSKTEDLSWKRAYFKIKFPDKKKARKFIELYKQSVIS